MRTEPCTYSIPPDFVFLDYCQIPPPKRFKRRLVPSVSTGVSLVCYWARWISSVF